jgi:single-strand DNA-binding protein
MASLNKIQLIGNLGMDPEVVYMPSGDPLAKFSLATTETWKDKSGDKQEKTQWHRVEVWGKLAETVRDYCTKGKQVYLEGQMTYEEYADKDGNKKTSAKVKLSGPRAVLVLLGGGDRGTTRRSEQPRNEPQNLPTVDDDLDSVPF